MLCYLLYPVPRFTSSGKRNRDALITDDEIYEMLVHKLPAGVTLNIVMDCCHSGTACDLPWGWDGSGVWEKAAAEKSAVAGTVVCFSGCADDEESVSTTQGSTDGQKRGAMTTALIVAVSAGESTYEGMYSRIEQEIKGYSNVTQHPYLTCSRQLLMTTTFAL